MAIPTIASIPAAFALFGKFLLLVKYITIPTIGATKQIIERPTFSSSPLFLSLGAKFLFSVMTLQLIRHNYQQFSFTKLNQTVYISGGLRLLNSLIMLFKTGMHACIIILSRAESPDLSPWNKLQRA